MLSLYHCSYTPTSLIRKSALRSMIFAFDRIFLIHQGCAEAPAASPWRYHVRLDRPVRFHIVIQTFCVHHAGTGLLYTEAKVLADIASRAVPYDLRIRPLIAGAVPARRTGISGRTDDTSLDHDLFLTFIIDPYCRRIRFRPKCPGGFDRASHAITAARMFTLCFRSPVDIEFFRCWLSIKSLIHSCLYIISKWSFRTIRFWPFFHVDSIQLFPIFMQVFL